MKLNGEWAIIIPWIKKKPAYKIPRPIQLIA